MYNSKAHSSSSSFICLILAFAIFAVDIFLPHGLALSVPYVLVIALSHWSQKESQTFVWSAICSVLTVLGFMISSRGIFEWQEIINRIISILAIWSVALLSPEPKRLKETLKESEMRFRQLASKISDIVCIISIDQEKVVYVSEGYERLTGYSAKELKKDFDLWFNSIHKDERDSIKAKFFQDAARGEFDETYRMTHSDGSVFWVRDRAFPIQNHSGEIYRIGRVVEDITESKNREDRLVQEKSDLEKVFLSLPDAAMLFDFESITLIRQNDFSKDALGFDEESFGNLTYQEIESRKSENEVKDWFLEIQRKGSVRKETTFKTKEGSIIDVDIRASLLALDGKEVVSITFRDITSEKGRVSELLNRGKIAKTVFNKIPAIVFKADAKGHFTYCSGNGLESIGFNPDAPDLKDLAAKFVIPQDRVDEVLSRKSANFEVEGTWGGEPWFFEVNAVLDTVSGNEIIGFAYNITDRRSKELRLLELNDHLKVANDDVKTEHAVLQEKLFKCEKHAAVGTLASGIITDLKNPLDSIISLCNRALATNGNARVEDFYNGYAYLLRDAQRCEKSLSEISRFTSESMGEIVEMDLNEIVRKSRIFTRKYLEAHGVELEVKLSNSLTPVYIDPVATQMILINLIEYSVANLSSDKIVVRTTETPHLVKVSISSNGKGITSEIQRQALQPMARVTSDSEALGLSIVNALVKQQGGKLVVESDQVNGAMFFIEIPKPETIQPASVI